MSELNAIVKSIEDINTKIDANYATKIDFAKLSEALNALQAVNEKAALKSKVDPIFGNEAVAKEFVEYLGFVVKQSATAQKYHKPESEFYSEKATLNATTNTAGQYLVPTSIYPILQQLVAVGGLARQVHDVIPTQGSLEFKVGSSADASAVYTTNDTTALTQTDRVFSSISLTPKQIGAFIDVSGKLLFSSAIPVATIVATSLARAAGVLEDQTVLYGDGSSTYGSMTGYEDNTNISGTVSVASVSAITYDNMISAVTAAHESTDGNGTFYMPRNVLHALRKVKGTSNDHYIVDVQENGFVGPMGIPVKIWNRMHDGSSTGDMVVLYGDLRSAGKIVTGRDLAIDVDASVGFKTGLLCWRLLEDFAFGVVNPNAVSKIRIGSTT